MALMLQTSLSKHVFCVVTSAQVILQKSEVESVVHSPGDYILLSADKYEIKVKMMLFFSLLKKPYGCIVMCELSP